MNIGEASKASGVSQRMIRHYEKIGLIPPAPRRDSGYRDYSDADVHRLRFIANARDLGFPVEEIATLLALWSDGDRASSEVKALAISRAQELGRKARGLDAMREALLDLAGRCHGDNRPDCPILKGLERQKPPPARWSDISATNAE
jgi:MerR family copper efflux transcriptional regulator